MNNIVKSKLRNLAKNKATFDIHKNNNFECDIENNYDYGYIDGNKDGQIYLARYLLKIIEKYENKNHYLARCLLKIIENFEDK